jgi:sortase A
MRIVVAAGSRIWISRAQHAAFAVAILLLGYSGFALADTWAFQRHQDVRLQQLLRPVSAPAVPAVPASPVATDDGLIGRIEVSRLGISVIVMEGDSEVTLQHSVGHIIGTALPGQPGNVGLAGHRDSFFRPLRDIRVGDFIALTTPGGDFRYRVDSTRIVTPDDVSVLDSDSHQILTLVTCYPFYFVGAAPSRFIVRAERID